MDFKDRDKAVDVVTERLRADLVSIEVHEMVPGMALEFGSMRELSGDLTVTLSSKIAAFGKSVRRVTLHTPANWLEHLRKDLLESWPALRRVMRGPRFEILREDVEIFKAACPHLASEGRGRQAHIEWVVAELAKPAPSP